MTDINPTNRAAACAASSELSEEFWLELQQQERIMAVIKMMATALDVSEARFDELANMSVAMYDSSPDKVLLPFELLVGLVHLETGAYSPRMPLP